MLAAECSLEVGEFVHTLGDYHIYHEHFNAVDVQLNRKPLKLPNLIFKKKNFFEYKLNDFILDNYSPHPSIKASMNV